jgi:hypothetical protein
MKSTRSMREILTRKVHKPCQEGRKEGGFEPTVLKPTPEMVHIATTFLCDLVDRCFERIDITHKKR